MRARAPKILLRLNSIPLICCLCIVHTCTYLYCASDQTEALLLYMSHAKVTQRLILIFRTLVEALTIGINLVQGRNQQNISEIFIETGPIFYILNFNNINALMCEV